MADPVYDSIGLGYADVRQPDPRIEQQIHAALGGAVRVVNVGAGAGSYEPRDRQVVAVEPSTAMIAQRPADAAPVVRAVADRLPFADGAFDGALALLTVHHWPDVAAGLAEVRRVTDGPVVVFTFDHDVHGEQWLVAEYLPAMLEIDTDVPRPAELASMLGEGSRVEVVPVPRDCRDGFCHAYWRRPEAYLDPRVRAGISGIARMRPDDVERGMQQMAADLADGTWRARHADLLDRAELDVGYRLVVSPGPP